MIFGNQELVKKMNALMLEYADIVPVDRNQIIQFFQKKRIFYRDEYIDFLARFGGKQSEFFNDFNCTFQEVSDVYFEEPEYELPPKGYGVFSVHSVESFFFIELATGEIYTTTYANGRGVPDELAYYNIDAFIWHLLYFHYFHYFLKDREMHKDSSVNISNYFSQNYSNYELVKIRKEKNYLKDNKLYFYTENRNEYFIHTLSDDFIQKLYR